MAINCRFIAEIMFCLIPQVLRFLKVRCGLSKRSGLFLIQCTPYDFFYRPCNFHFNILSGFEIIAKTLSVALEVSFFKYI